MVICNMQQHQHLFNALRDVCGFIAVQEDIDEILEAVRKDQAPPQRPDETDVSRSAIYIGEEFQEHKGKTFFVDNDLNDEGCYIMKVGHDWINSIPKDDLTFTLPKP